MEKHTELPWEVDAMGYIRGPNGENILEHKDNCFFVLRAVNNHEAMLAMLRECAEQIGAFGAENGGMYPILNPLMDLIKQASDSGSLEG